MDRATKQEYIIAWQKQIDTLGILAFCSDIELSNQVQEHLDALKDLVPRIADTKTHFTRR